MTQGRAIRLGSVFAMVFWTSWVIAAAVTVVALGFFLVGLTNGTVSSFNAGIWVLILPGTVGVTWGSWMLKKNGRPGWGALLALVLALPVLVGLLVLLLTLGTGASWI